MIETTSTQPTNQPRKYLQEPKEYQVLLQIPIPSDRACVGRGQHHRHR